MTDRDITHFNNLPFTELAAMALKAKLQNRGPSFSLCTISNARSGRCGEDCAFCAQSAHYNTAAPEYGLKSTDELVKEAIYARESGATRFSIVTSGRGISGKDVERIGRCIATIRKEAGINVCASLGIMTRDALEELKHAGLSRYHHNLEVSREFFPAICTTHSYEERVSTIVAAKEAGLEVCAGGLLGLGEKAEHRASLALEIKALEVDSVPLNVLVPIKGTPLYGTPPLPVWEILHTIAFFRLIMPGTALRLAGGRDTVLKDFQGLAFMAGADAMLTGGYLTVRGRPVQEDLKMVNEIKQLWEQEIKATIIGKGSIPRLS